MRQRCQSVTDDEGVVKIVDEDDHQGTRIEMDADGGIHDYGVIGIVEGSKIYSEPKQNFNSSVESEPYRFFSCRNFDRWSHFQRLYLGL